MKKIFAEWETHLRRPLKEIGVEKKTSPLELMRRQIEKLASDLREREQYKPFVYGD